MVDVLGATELDFDRQHSDPGGGFTPNLLCHGYRTLHRDPLLRGGWPIIDDRWNSGYHPPV
jgi:hypothetical protein